MQRAPSESWSAAVALHRRWTEATAAVTVVAAPPPTAATADAEIAQAATTFRASCVRDGVHAYDAMALMAAIGEGVVERTTATAAAPAPAWRGAMRKFDVEVS